MWQTILATALTLAQPAPPTDGWQRLKTPRGGELELKLQMPPGQNYPILILAPGQSCNSRRPFFEAMAQAAREAKVGLVRLEWSYCVTNSANPQPSDDLSAESADLRAVLDYVRKLPGVKPSQLLIGGKSLGSLVSWKVFKTEPALKAAALLTPVCSYDQDEQGKPLATRQKLTGENYPELAKEARPLLFLFGNQDSLCYPPILYESLAQTKGNATVEVFGGGHSLNLLKPDHTEDAEATASNLKTAAQALFNWIKLTVHA